MLELNLFQLVGKATFYLFIICFYILGLILL